MTNRNKYEMGIISERVHELCIEYNQSISKKRLSTVNVKTDLDTGYVLINFKKYAYLVFPYEDKYVFSWFRLSGVRSVCDGLTLCNDLSETVREINDRLFSLFSPERGNRWYTFSKRTVWGSKKKKKKEKRG
jgi:hypothetical protein